MEKITGIKKAVGEYKTFTIGSTEYTVCDCTAIAKDS